MLDHMTPEQFRERYAYWLIMDQINPRRRHAEILAELHNIVTRYVFAKNGQTASPSKLATADKLLSPIYGGGTAANMTDINDVNPEDVAKSLGCI